MKKGTFGIIGLGKMGGSLAMQATDKNYKVVGYDASHSTKLKNEGLLLVDSISDLANNPLRHELFSYTFLQVKRSINY
jgi:6-phosphogluconate dehydrogenase